MSHSPASGSATDISCRPVMAVSFVPIAVICHGMTFVVPFDGSLRTKSALMRAAELGAALGEDVLVIAIIPSGNTTYARQRG